LGKVVGSSTKKQVTDGKNESEESKNPRERIVLTEHRYMREDVEHGLAFLVSVCEWAGVPCPVARGLLALGSAVLGKDLRKEGRTLEGLGLASLSKEELQRTLQ